MPNSKKPVYSNLELLRAMMDPACKPKSQFFLEAEEHARKVVELLEIRDNYTWEWSAGAKYLFSELIRAYGLDAFWQELVMDMAKSKRGRKSEAIKADWIRMMKSRGMTAKQITEQLTSAGHAISVSGVEAYLKTRRKRSPEEQVGIAIKKAQPRRGKSPGNSSR